MENHGDRRWPRCGSRIHTSRYYVGAELGRWSIRYGLPVLVGGYRPPGRGLYGGRSGDNRSTCLGAAVETLPEQLPELAMMLLLGILAECRCRPLVQHSEEPRFLYVEYTPVQGSVLPCFLADDIVHHTPVAELPGVYALKIRVCARLYGDRYAEQYQVFFWYTGFDLPLDVLAYLLLLVVEKKPGAHHRDEEQGQEGDDEGRTQHHSQRYQFFQGLLRSGHDSDQLQCGQCHGLLARDRDERQRLSR